MKNNKLKYIFLALPIFFATQALAAGNWKLSKDKNDIKIYTKKQEGSSFKSFKAVAKFKTNIDKLVTVFDNFNLTCSWMYRCIEYKNLKDINNNAAIHYYSFKSPSWPVEDRDSVFQRTKVANSDGTITYKIDSQSDYVPKKDKLVRIPKMNGYFKFTPKGDNEVEVIYELNADPGGSLPAAIANAVVVDSPFDSLSNLKKKVE